VNWGNQQLINASNVSTTNLETDTIGSKSGGGVTWEDSQDLNGKNATNGNFYDTNGKKINKETNVTICISPESCDVVCDAGVVDCRSNIQQAIDDVTAAGGGEIKLGKGTFWVSMINHGYLNGNINISLHFDAANYVSFIGSGRFNTIIRPMEGSNGTVIYYNSSSYLKLADFTIYDYNNTKSFVDGHACLKGHASALTDIRNLILEDCSHDGFYPTSCSWSHYENIRVNNAQGFGIILDSEDFGTFVNPMVRNSGKGGESNAYGLDIVGGGTKIPARVSIVGGFIYNATNAGLRIVNAQGVSISGIKVTSATTGHEDDVDGILITNSDGISIVNSQIYDNPRHGIFISGSNYSSITSNVITNNNQKNSASGNGIYIDDAYGNTISANEIYDYNTTVSQNYAIVEDGTSDNNTFNGNTVYQNKYGAIVPIGTLTYYCNNPGYAYCKMPPISSISNTLFVNGTNQSVAYSFEENGGVYTYDDGSYGLTATMNNMNLGLNNCTGNCSGLTSSGYLRNGIEFDGIDDLLNISHNLRMNTSSQMTFEAWVYSKSPLINSFGTIWYDGAASGTNRILLKKLDGSMLIQYNIGGSAKSITTPANTINPNKWHHVILTYTGTDLILYVNGVNIGSIAATGNILTSTSSRIIGRDSSGAYFFNGTIDEVKLWTRSSNYADVQTSYNLGLGTRSGIGRLLQKSDGYTGTCANGTALTVVNGQITGCS